jgi:hypothetical protein
MKTMALVGGATLILLGSWTSALAQRGGILPECFGMREQRSCSCALSNGGRIVDDPHRPGRKGWRSPRIGSAAHMAFMNCSNGSRR